MSTDHRAKLATIKRFDQLIAYLRDEMGWPIARDSFEDVDDLFYDFTADELGIDHKTAAKIQEIKRLRPLSPNQPWGIFFVKFEPKKLPVVALRRILSQVALKKRASANSAERVVWAADDLLFISNYGEGEERQISFAHFSRAQDGHDLPTLKVLGWDNLDTALHLDAVARELTEHLAWPEDDDNAEAWRTRWCAAFTLRPREVVSTSKELAIRLAELARAIRDRIKTALAIETEKGPLTQLMKAFQMALVHDLDADGFADMYAQTIAYGLLSARITDPHRKTPDDFAAHMRTNPFLRELMQTFLRVGGRRGKAGSSGIDFDELGISEVVELLDDANIEAVVRDFGDRNPQEDPVIHFYELFLTEYDAKKRIQRGVFYTPRPVVSYIVRSVDQLLRSEFGLADGLADTTTWDEMARRHPNIGIPDGVNPRQDFIQILDPATGTGTFLVEAIDLIHKTLVSKWKAQRHNEETIDALWNEYVPKHLLTRLHGYELLMAPYAIAHLKIGLKLYETGYRFGGNERARVYLTNALEAAHDFSGRFEFAIPALAHEATAVNEVKRVARFTVCIGNPPYAGRSWNLTAELRKAVEPYRSIRGERIREKGALQLEKSIQDDYVKFFRLSQLRIDESRCGIVGLVTSHGFLDNPSLRGMRFSILSSFNKLFLLDLHGNVLRQERSPDGSPDKNVFDIKDTGVAISLLRKLSNDGDRTVEHADLWGSREFKYPWLIGSSVAETSRVTISVREPQFLFISQDVDRLSEYEQWHSIGEIMPVHSKGVVTGRDHFVIDFDRRRLLERMREFAESEETDAHLVEEFDLNPTDWWHVAEARREMPKPSEFNRYVRRLLYRPFDTRVCFYHPAVLMSPRRPTMRHMDPGRDNLLLVTSRMTKGERFQHALVTKDLAEAILLSSKTSNNAIVFPLYLYPDGDAHAPQLEIDRGRRPNFTPEFLQAVRHSLRLNIVDGRGDLTRSIGIEDISDFTLAVLHSPMYRKRYADPLSRDFPRVPLPGNLQIFRSLSRLGRELVSFHLLTSGLLDKPQCDYRGEERVVSRVGWTSHNGGTVWIDGKGAGENFVCGSSGFSPVPEDVWAFHIGGYRVCEKWLKDRKGRKLSDADITHYNRISVALREIINRMSEIDDVIEQHGGWPTAFSGGASQELPLLKVAEPQVPYGPRD
jgi:predicted helicase